MPAAQGDWLIFFLVFLVSLVVNPLACLFPS